MRPVNEGHCRQFCLVQSRLLLSCVRSRVVAAEREAASATCNEQMYSSVFADSGYCGTEQPMTVQESLVRLAPSLGGEAASRGQTLLNSANAVQLRGLGARVEPRQPRVYGVMVLLVASVDAVGVADFGQECSRITMAVIG